MTGLVRKATLFGVCAVMAASTALASVPDLTNSRIHDSFPGSPRSTSLPIYIDVARVASNGVIANIPAIHPTRGGSLITLEFRDFANNAVTGAAVEIDFSAACDVNLSTATDGGTLAGQVVSGTTDALGQFNFRIGGAAKGANAPNYLPAGSGTTSTAEVAIRVNTVLFANAFPVVWDQNVTIPPTVPVGSPTGVNAGDIGFIITSGQSGIYVARSDVSHSGLVAGIAAKIGFELSRFGGGLTDLPVNQTKGPGCPAP